MGYLPPCQPPLVAAESSSPQSIPKNESWIVDFLFPRNLLLSGRVSGHIAPKCFVSRVVSNSVSRRLRSFSPGAEFLFSPRCPFPFSGVARSLSKLRFGCDLWGSVSIHSEEWMARFPPVMSVSSSFSRGSNPWFGFIYAVCCNRGCPEELLLLLLPAVHSHWYYCNWVAALPVPHFQVVVWQIFAEAPILPVSGGTFDLRRFRIFPSTSRPLSLGFVTNTLLGLSRPVGKGPRGFPRKPSTTPCGAALYTWEAEANKVYAFFGRFPAEMRG